jgi:hypothetical protein
MKTFRIKVETVLTVTVPDSFTEAMREDAQPQTILNRDGDDAKVVEPTPFLAQLQAQYPDDDEEFTRGIIRNGVRMCITSAIKNQFSTSGIGVRVAPAKLTDLEFVIPSAAEVNTTPE